MNVSGLEFPSGLQIALRHACYKREKAGQDLPIGAAVVAAGRARSLLSGFSRCPGITAQKVPKIFLSGGEVPQPRRPLCSLHVCWERARCFLALHWFSHRCLLGSSEAVGSRRPAGCNSSTVASQPCS